MERDHKCCIFIFFSKLYYKNIWLLLNDPKDYCFKSQLCPLKAWFRCYFFYVCQYVCLSVCLYPRREVISQLIFKYDISTDAYLQPEGVSENRFKIKPDVEKLWLKTHNRAKFRWISKFRIWFDSTKICADPSICHMYIKQKHTKTNLKKML